MYNYEVIASYWVVYKQRDTVLSFFPVNSEIIFCMFSFFYAHVLQINPLLPFFNIFSGTHVRPCVQVATPLYMDEPHIVTPFMRLDLEDFTSTDDTNWITLTLKMTSAQVVETSDAVTKSSFQNYTHPDHHSRQATVTRGFEPFTIPYVLVVLIDSHRY